MSLIPVDIVLYYKKFTLKFSNLPLAVLVNFLYFTISFFFSSVYFLVFLAFFLRWKGIIYYLLPKTLKLVPRPPWLNKTGAGAQGGRQLFLAGLPVWLGPPSIEQDRGGRVFGWHLFGVCGAGCLPFSRVHLWKTHTLPKLRLDGGPFGFAQW